MSQYFEGIMSKYQCGFPKGRSVQHASISLLEKWRCNVDQGRMFGALLTDLSKALHCLRHDIIIAKLYAYGFHMKTLDFIHDYLRCCKQRTRTDNVYSKTYYMEFLKDRFCGLYYLISLREKCPYLEFF